MAHPGVLTRLASPGSFGSARSGRGADRSGRIVAKVEVWNLDDGAFSRPPDRCTTLRRAGGRLRVESGGRPSGAATFRKPGRVEEWFASEATLGVIRVASHPRITLSEGDPGLVGATLRGPGPATVDIDEHWGHLVGMPGEVDARWFPECVEPFLESGLADRYALTFGPGGGHSPRRCRPLTVSVARFGDLWRVRCPGVATSFLRSDIVYGTSSLTEVVARVFGSSAELVDIEHDGRDRQP